MPRQSKQNAVPVPSLLPTQSPTTIPNLARWATEAAGNIRAALLNNRKLNDDELRRLWQDLARLTTAILPAQQAARFRYESLDASWHSCSESLPLHVLSLLDDVSSSPSTSAPPPSTSAPSGGAEQGEGEANNRAKGIPRAEAEILVRAWLLKHAKNNPAGITRDAVAAGTDVSAGQVSKTAAWKAFRKRRDAEAKPGGREVPLTDAMQAVVPSDCETPDELVALIEEQRADEAEENRRHKRRHKPS